MTEFESDECWPGWSECESDNAISLASLVVGSECVIEHARQYPWAAMDRERIGQRRGVERWVMIISLWAELWSGAIAREWS